MMASKHAFLLLVACATTSMVHGSQLETVLLQIEASVNKVAAVAEADYAQWICGDDLATKDETDCYFEMCKGAIQNPTCSADRDEKNAFGGCLGGYEFAVLGYDETSVSFAADPNTESSTKKLSIYSELFWTGGMKDVFNAENYATPSASWQYIGTPNGMWRLYPAIPHETDSCYGYDPRIRPWYVAASSGPKDVIIVIDRSGSMSSSNRMGITIEAVQTVLTTLTVNDYVAIISFDSVGEQLCSGAVKCGQLAQATKANKAILTSMIGKLTPRGGTDFFVGLSKALALWDADGTAEGVHSSGCSRALLFLTDGEDSSGNDQLALQVKEMNEALEKPAIMFTYSLGSGANHEIPKQIACDGNGIWSPVLDNGNIRGQMSHFYDYFASQRASGDSRLAWVESYMDANGAGLMTTASKAIYDKSVSPPVLVAVIGIDILMVDIVKAAQADGVNDENALLQALARRSSTCVDVNVDGTTDDDDARCALAALRSIDHSLDASSSATSRDSSTASRLCPSDPTECTVQQPSCMGTAFGNPQTLATSCINEDAVKRTLHLKDMSCFGAVGCNTSTNTYNASNDPNASSGERLRLGMMVWCAFMVSTLLFA